VYYANTFSFLFRGDVGIFAFRMPPSPLSTFFVLFLEPRSQFHQHYTSSFCTNILAQKSQSKTVSRENMFVCNAADKMLVILTQGQVNAVTG